MAVLAGVFEADFLTLASGVLTFQRVPVSWRTFPHVCLGEPALGPCCLLAPVVVQSLSRVRLFLTPWTVARQAPLSVELPRQEYWSGLPSPPPGESSRPRAQSLVSCLAGRFFTTEPPRNIPLMSPYGSGLFDSEVHTLHLVGVSDASLLTHDSAFLFLAFICE